MKKSIIARIGDFISRWQIYLYIASAIVLLMCCIGTKSANGLMLIPLIPVISAIAYKTAKDIISMFKDIADDEENNGTD